MKPRKPMTLEEIAQELGVSRQMVYKIEQRALRKARDMIKSSGLTLQEILTDENCKIRGTQEVPSSEVHGKVQPASDTAGQKEEG